MSTSDLFWTKVSKRYAKQRISNPDGYEATLARTLSYLRQTDEVLEIGAGTSSTALRLAPHVANYLATDFSAGMTEIGQTKAFDASIPGLRVAQAALGDETIGAGPYDAVLALNLLHLLPDLDGDLGKVAAVLPTGGVFISKSVCLGRSGWALRAMIRVMQMVGKAPYVSFFTAPELEARIKAAGFEIVESDDYGKRMASQYIVARKI